MEKERSFSFNQLCTSALLDFFLWMRAIDAQCPHCIFMCFASHATCQPIPFWLLSQPFSGDSLTWESTTVNNAHFSCCNFAAICDYVHLLENMFSPLLWVCPLLIFFLHLRSWCKSPFQSPFLASLAIQSLNVEILESFQSAHCV